MSVPKKKQSEPEEGPEGQLLVVEAEAAPVVLVEGLAAPVGRDGSVMVKVLRKAGGRGHQGDRPGPGRPEGED